MLIQLVYIEAYRSLDENFDMHQGQTLFGQPRPTHVLCRTSYYSTLPFNFLFLSHPVILCRRACLLKSTCLTSLAGRVKTYQDIRRDGSFESAAANGSVLRLWFSVYAGGI